MTTALAPSKTNTEVAEVNADTFTIPGMEHVTPGELRVPILKLVQAQSKMVDAAGHEGQFYNSVTNEFSTNPEVLIIGVAKGRVMFPDQYNADNKPTCGSDDGKTPREAYIGAEIQQVVTKTDGKKQINILVIPPECEACPFAQWGENGTPPACSEVNTFAAVGEDGLPAIFQCKSTGMKAAAALKTLVAANGIRKIVRFGAAKESNDTGVYYVPVFTPGPKPSKEWQQTALRLATMGNFAERNQAAALEQDHQSAGQASPSGSTYDTGPAEEPPDSDLPF